MISYSKQWKAITQMGSNSEFKYPDASPTYRGYRHQALYILNRIVKADPSVVFRPEFREDLATFDSNANLLELVQVKDHSSPLQLSDFDLKAKSGFFARCADTLSRYPNVRITIATFGEVGGELRRAVESDGPERTSVSKKIADAGIITLQTACAIFAKIEFEDCSEAALEKSITDVLAQLVTALNPTETFDALSYWVLQCSENSRNVTRTDLGNRIQSIGKYIADMTSHEAEWLSTIIPIENTVASSDRLSKLKAEYNLGVAARYEHIQAELDILRPARLRSLAEKLSIRNVVFIHAPSGEGKSTLAYRFLRDYCPGIARLEIKQVTDSAHAQRIARALGAHVRTLGLPVIVYLDIPAQHNAWISLIKEISFYSEIKVVATIREEDWRKANVSGAEFQWHELELEFNQREASELFERLRASCPMPSFTGFEEAWARFGGKGPLLEFVFLLTQGGLLRERLQQQIRELQDQVRRSERSGSELDLLRMVSVASTLGASLVLRPLLEELRFSMSGNPLYLLEKEYLVRTTKDGMQVEGLHPVRSRIVAELLCDPATSSWGESARTCLPFVDAKRLEAFLLGAFSEKRGMEEQISDGLKTLGTLSWDRMASITRALIWLGVSRYVIKNIALIRHVESELGLPWVITLDVDISEISKRDQPYFKDLVPDEAWERMKELRQQQSPKSEVFAQLKEWLKTRRELLQEPASNEDWHGLAETMYWSAREGNILPFESIFPWEDAEAAISRLPAETLGNLIVAMHECFEGTEEFESWINRNRSELVDCYRDQTLTINVLEDEEDRVTARFIVRLDLWPNPSSPDFDQARSNNLLHAETLFRLRLLRKLFPDKLKFSCQGFGHSIFAQELPFDDTTKADVLRENLLLEWPVQVNAIFRGLSDFELRLSTWGEYANEVFEIRQAAVKSFEKLTGVLVTYFEEKSFIQLGGALLNVEHWGALCRAIDSVPRLPRCAVDPHGFLSESNASASSDTDASGFSVARFLPWKHAIDNYSRSVCNFMRQAIIAAVIQSAIGRGQSKLQSKTDILRKIEQQGLDQRFVPLSLNNLTDAIERLASMQWHFRELFVAQVDGVDMEKLEKNELDALSRLWSIWYDFVSHPTMVIRDPSSVCQLKDVRLKEQFIKDFTKGFERLRVESELVVHVRELDFRIDGERSVRIQVDSRSIASSGVCLESILAVLRSAFRTSRDSKRLRHFLDREWSRIAVIPSVDGMVINLSGWILRPYMLCDVSDLSFWSAQQTPISRPVIDGLGLLADNFKRLEIATDFLGFFSEFLLVANHVREIIKLDDSDEFGFGVLQRYISEFQSERFTNLQRAIDSATEMMAYFNELSEHDLESREDLLNCMAALREWLNVARIPQQSDDGSFKVSLSDIADWSHSLHQALEYACAAWAYWLQDVVKMDKDEMVETLT